MMISAHEASEGSIEANKRGQGIIRDYVGAVERLERLRSQVASAECELANARNALGKFLIPEGSKPGEKIGIWFGGNDFQSIVRAELLDAPTPEYKITIERTK